MISGCAVLLALSGLFAIGMNAFDGMALGTMIAVATMVLSALTLLPAVTMLTHRRLGRAEPHQGVERTPARVGGSRPAAHRRSSAGRRTELDRAASRACVACARHSVSDVRRRHAAAAHGVACCSVAGRLSAWAGGSSPILVTVPAPESEAGNATASRLIGIARGNPAVRKIDSYRDNRALRSAQGDVGLVEIGVDAQPEQAAAQDMVAALREITGPGVSVGGLPGERLDEVERYASRLPIAVAVVLLATALMLWIAFRSVLMPVKAVIATLLSAGAALGAVTWVFQEGHLAELFGFQQIMAFPRSFRSSSFRSSSGSRWTTRSSS